MPQTKRKKSSAKTSSRAAGKQQRCWKGYEPVPGKKPYSKGSCRKKK